MIDLKYKNFIELKKFELKDWRKGWYAIQYEDNEYCFKIFKRKCVFYIGMYSLFDFHLQFQGDKGIWKQHGLYLGRQANPFSQIDG
jgi:hypothetical protein